MEKCKYEEGLFDFKKSIAGELLLRCESLFDALSKIDEFIEIIKERGDFREHSEGVFIGREVKISKNAEILPPLVIDDGAEIRQGAYIRGRAIIGRGCVIGNSSEVKNSIIFDGGKLPHYNYVGDSIVGALAHLGAGAIISNLRLDGGEVKVRGPLGDYESGRRKLGALVGDGAEIGCGAVLCPGSIIGRGALVYPLSRVTGVIPEGKIFDGKEIRERRK